MTDLRGLLEWQDEDKYWLAEIAGLTGLLKRCLIDKNHKISDAWGSAIHLTPAGIELSDQLRSKRTKPNDAVMAVFLRLLAGSTFFVDRMTDPDVLRKLLSEEVLAGKIRYPYVLGRTVADVVFRDFPGEVALSSVQTMKLLDQLPIGVFQEGSTVVGPLGAFKSRALRALPAPPHEVPGYFCSEAHCRILHMIDLSTGSSSVQKAQSRLYELVAKNYKTDPEVHSNVSRILKESYGLTSERSSTDLINVISDDLTDDELRVVVDRLIREICRDQQARLQLQKQWNMIIADPADVLHSRDRAHLEQMILYFSDEEICRSIDHCVRAKKIVVDSFSVRGSVLSRFPGGVYDLSAQIGSHGIRFIDGSASGFISNLSKLIREIYTGDDAILGRQDLAFALDVTQDQDLEGALRSYIVSTSPEEIIDSLILSSREASNFAAVRYAIEPELAQGRSIFGSILRWKLGSPQISQVSKLNELRSQCEEMRQLCANSSAVESELRGVASNMFVAFEEVLQTSLAYSTWALTTDHYAQLPRFSYNLDLDSHVLEWIELNSPTDDFHLKLAPGGKNTLVPLAAGFARLAKGLRSSAENKSRHLRPEKDFPLQCTNGDATFAFSYTQPFLNLGEDCTRLVLEDLREVSRLSQSQELALVRNSVMHGNTEFPSRDRIASATNEIFAVLNTLEFCGLSPMIFELVERKIDRFGRELIELGHADQLISLQYPCVDVAPGLPYQDRRQLIMPKYWLGDAGPLRFRLESGSPRRDYWENWPPRWPERENVGIGESGRSEFLKNDSAAEVG